MNTVVEEVNEHSAIALDTAARQMRELDIEFSWEDVLAWAMFLLELYLALRVEERAREEAKEVTIASLPG